jgi:hypothetical protein
VTLRELVDRGIELRRQIKEQQAELKQIEQRLEALGLRGPQEELADPERDGRRFLARGSTCIIPVVFCADKLVASFKDGGNQHEKVAAAAGDRLADFYELNKVHKVRFETGKKFRAVATDLLGPKTGALVTACLQRDKFGVPKSDTKILWDDPVLE